MIETRTRTPFRPATPDDANALAGFVNMAGEGLPLYLWQDMAEPGASPWDVGRARARRDTGSFSYRHATFRMAGSEIAACLIGYALDDAPAAPIAPDTPAMFVPLEQLEAMVPGTWYINALATRETHRGRGYGTELLALAETLASACGSRGLSLIVADTNTAARELYRKRGFRERARRAMVKSQWQHPGTQWVLMSLEY